MAVNQDKMKTRAIFPLLMSMAVPMMLSMLMQSLYNIVDSIFVARLGPEALTAVSLVYPLQNIVVSVAVGIGVGISSAISISIGGKDFEKANKTASIGMLLTVIHAVLFLVVGIVVTKPFLSMFTENAVILQYGCEYSYIVLCLAFGCLLQISMEKIFQAVGDMVTTMALLASGCIINIILDPIMIFGLLGFPALGVKGAAIATVIGQISAFLLYVLVYRKKDIGIKISLKYVSFDKGIIKQIYSVGIPSTIMMALPSLLVSILNGILSRFSDLHVAVLGIYFKLQTFIYMPANGVVQGMRPIIGFNYGAGEKKRMKQTVHLSLLVVFCVMLIGTIGALVFPRQILMLFDATDDMMKIGTEALRVISLGFLVSSIGIVNSGTFEALGRGKESLIVSLLRQFVVTVPLGYLLSRSMRALGIWIAFPVAEVLAAVVAHILLKKIYRKIACSSEGKNKDPDLICL